MDILEVAKIAHIFGVLDRPGIFFFGRGGGGRTVDDGSKPKYVKKESTPLGIYLERHLSKTVNVYEI